MYVSIYVYSKCIICNNVTIYLYICICTCMLVKIYIIITYFALILVVHGPYLTYILKINTKIRFSISK